MIRALTLASMLAILPMVACTSPIDPASVIAGAQTACMFAPTAESVAALMTASPNLKTATSVINLICAAFNAHKASMASGAMGAPATAPDGTVSFTVVVGDKVVVITGKEVK